jgi:hypothetical protein
MMLAHPAAALGFLFAGFIIWAARFLAIYVFTALACAKGFAGASLADIGIVPAFIGAATLIAIAANIWVILHGVSRVRRQPEARDEFDAVPFVGYVAAAVAALSIVAIVWETLPVLIIPVCM